MPHITGQCAFKYPGLLHIYVGSYTVHLLHSLSYVTTEAHHMPTGQPRFRQPKNSYIHGCDVAQVCMKLSEVGSRSKDVRDKTVLDALSVDIPGCSVLSLTYFVVAERVC